MEIYTIRDVARRAGVAVSTVSRVLNGRPDVSEETRRRVMEVVEECGFVQNGNARFLKRTRTEFAAIIVRGRRNVFLSDVAEQMLACAQGLKTPFLVKYIDEADDEFETMRKIYAEKRAGSFIFLGARLDERSEAMCTLGVPCVVATVDASGLDYSNVSSVFVDDKAATYAMTERMIRAGHTQIAIFGARSEGGDPFGQRYHGAIDAMAAHGITFDPEHYRQSRFELGASYETAKRFFEEHRDVTGVITMSDTIATGVIRALHDVGLRVPQDVSVTGFDGAEMSRYFIPSIATVAQPVEAIARESVTLLCQMMEGGEPKHVTVDYELIDGESLGKKKA